jgi:hypothetical protein
MMTRNRLLLGLLIAALATACGDDDGGSETPDANTTNPDAPETPTPDAPPAAETIEVAAGDITTDRTWITGNTYILKGQVFIRGAKLTIQPGVTVKGDNGSALVITSTATIDAQGTAAAPIVFTSSQADPAPADWGGIVLHGNAPINVTPGRTTNEGFPPGDDAERISYGGTDAAHDCGTIKYARINYAGFILAANKELNGLTVAGCGTGTELDYIQVHRGADDGVEFFGGTAGISHLLISGPNDDGLDWDQGWSGRVQFLIVQQNDLTAGAGFEAAGNAANPAATPIADPVIWNFTVVGNAAITQKGLEFKQGTGGKMRNGIVMNFKKGIVDFLDASAAGMWTAGTLNIANTIFFNETALGDLWPAGFEAADEIDEQAVITAVATNKVGTNPMLTAPSNLTAPNFKPTALTTCGTPPAPFDVTATFCGAIGATDWTTGWTAFPE